MINNETPTVEEIQDLVERVLMELNYFEVAKNYILYRSSRKEKRESRDAIVAQFESFDLRVTLKGIERDFSEPCYDLSILNNKFKSFLHGELNDTQKIRLLIKAATELTSMEAPKWEYIAARVYLAQFNANIKARMKEL